MKKIYACLIGNWVCLNDDPTCKMVFIMPHRICGMKKTLLSSPHLIVMQKIPIINWIMFTSTTRVRITELTLSSFKLLKNNFSRIALSCLGLQVVFYLLP